MIVKFKRRVFTNGETKTIVDSGELVEQRKAIFMVKLKDGKVIKRKNKDMVSKLEEVTDDQARAEEEVKEV